MDLNVILKGKTWLIRISVNELHPNKVFGKQFIITGLSFW